MNRMALTFITTTTLKLGSPNNVYRVHFFVTMEDGSARQMARKVAAASEAAAETALSAQEQAIKDKYKEKAQEREYDQVITDLFEGVDLDAKFDANGYPNLTRNDVRRKALRRVARRLGNHEPQGALQELANASAWVNSLTNATVAARLSKSGGTQWTNSEANTLIKQVLAGIAVDIAGYDHGKGDIDEDEA